MSLHALAQFNANMELQGRVLLGKDPDTPFLELSPLAAWRA